MKKTLLLFLLLPFFGFAQTDLVRWDNPNNFTPTVLAAHVTSTDMTGSNLSMLNYVGFTGTNWPTANSINSNTYIQISITADAGYRIDLTSLKYAYFDYDNPQTCRKYQIRYSKDPSFPSNGTLLLDNQSSLTGKNNAVATFPANVFLLPGETMYIRFYGYYSANGWNGARWGLISSHPDVNSGGTYSVPTINGNVSINNPTLKANNDNATSIKNNFVSINVLSNDTQAANPISTVTIASQSANGTAVVNADKTIKFSPADGFTGTTSFNYTIGDGTNTSTATVNVTVTDPTTTALVKWNGPDTKLPNILVSTNAVGAESMTNGSGITLDALANEGFKGSPWPTQFSIDATKYFQVSVSAKTGYKIKLNAFNFTYRGDANLYVQRYQVRYSKDDFATSTLLIDDQTGTGKVTKSLDLSNVTLYPGEKLTLRIYGYKLQSNKDNNSPLFLINSNTLDAGNTTPTFTGTVLNYDTNDLNANDDLVTTQEKRAVSFNPLTNDSNYAGAVITNTQPPAAAGTVTRNNNVFTFTPTATFKGTTSFTYTLTAGAKSSTATVSVTVTELTPRLIIWNGALQQPKAVVTDPNITGNDISAASMALATYSNPNYFNLSGVNGTPTFNKDKYVQVSITPKTNYRLTLTQFSFIYNSPTENNEGATKYQVRYSTDPTFADGGTVLAGETNAVLGADTQVTLNFPANTIVTSSTTQTFYIRIYPYAVPNQYNGYFKIKHDYGGEVGPTITGVVEPSNLLTANPDTASTAKNTAIPIAILSNDENYNPLTSITVTQPSTGGTVAVNGTTNVTFTPAADFVGTTTFTYTLFNGTDYSTATVTVNVTAPPCAATLTPGNNFWKGYVYTYTGNIPAATTYVGSVAEKANFERNVEYGTITGDATVEADNFCGPVPAENFLVRYLMQTTTVADTYNFTIGGDDGVRLYIDGNIVNVSPANSWSDHGYNTYVAQVPLSAGSHSFVYEYYEKGGIARVSFSYGAVNAANASLPFGINQWNVYGFNLPDLTLPSAAFAGTYVDKDLSFDSQKFWPKGQSPSYSPAWQGAPMPIDNFALTYKREGFPCGRYKLTFANFDDAVQIFIDGQEVYYYDGYSPNAREVNSPTLYFLNQNSRVEVRLRENGGDANVALNFVDNPTTYDGTGTFPSNTTSIKISTPTILNNDLQVCSCTIDAGASLTVPDGKTLTVDQDLNVNGKLILQNGGSLLQTTSSKDFYKGSTTSFELIRDTQPVRRYDFTYWSSPVTFESNFTLNNLSPATLGDKYYYYDAATSAWKINGKGTMSMALAKGYSVRAPQTYALTGSGQVYTATFKGIPNNGDIDATTSNSKWNLIGNPYPSAVDAEKFINLNLSLNGVETGALYFWTHKSLPSSAVAGDAKYNYTSDDYAVFNLTGHVVTHNNAVVGDGFIASGQAFFVYPTGTKSIVFNNDMRVGSKNGQFFKTAKTDAIEKNRLWLNFTNEQGAFKQILLGYMDGATNSIDLNYDAVTMSGNSYVDFYTISDAEKLTIQARALPFTDTEEVPLGYKSTIAGDFTISIDHVDGLFTSQAVYLEDKTNGKIVDLRAANYTFTTAVGTFTNRFVLKYTNKTLGTGDFENTAESVLISVKDKLIKITSSQENIKDILIYNIAGQQLYSKNKVNSSEHQISNLQSGEQVLLAKVTMENGYTVTKKIIFH
ncbi:Ig-like domain-containing protein [Flavobacterium hungaricum]|uniref:Tandem-95 repeat protein n=1 Tax=Flavobacterium hungaricum TaxID=2082725 RepID=A0ABR9TQW5_9FLAO|nr:tandem-95 repeat protein [Flavobacterium hungaricum]MBE8727444.1 tandem-95 repeat protein [Flavobacterium hungaricum]